MDKLDEIKDFMMNWQIDTVAPAYIKAAGERKAKEYLIYLFNRLETAERAVFKFDAQLKIEQTGAGLKEDEETKIMPSRKDLYGE